MNAPPGGIRFLLVVALSIGFCLRVYLILSTPVQGPSLTGELSSYNDEIAHVAYTEYLLKNGSLPTQSESIQAAGALERGHYEYYQPPVYYLIHAFVADVFDLRDAHSITYSGRWLSFILSIGLFLTWVLIARELALSSIQTLAGALFLALSGVIVRFSTTASNDSLLWLAAGAGFLYIIRLQRDSVRTADWIGFTLVSAFGIYTKLSAVLLLPIPLLLAADSRRFRQLPSALISLLAVALLTLPMWLRNVTEFGGLFPLAAGFGEASCGVPGLEFLVFAARSLVFPWSECWRGFMSSLLLIPPLTVIVMLVRNRAEANRYSAVFLNGFFLVLLAFIWLNFRYDQAEARYLFAAWPAFAFITARAVSSISDLRLLLIAFLIPYSLFLF